MATCECCRYEVADWTGYFCSDTKGWTDNEGRVFLCNRCSCEVLGQMGGCLTKAEWMGYVRQARQELHPSERREE